jgi:hypothetical protein
MGDSLKYAEKRVISDITDVSFQSLARLAVLSSRVSRSHLTSHVAGESEDPLTDPLLTEDPIGVSWSTATDYLPAITRYSTFDEPHVGHIDARSTSVVCGSRADGD